MSLAEFPANNAPRQFTESKSMTTVVPANSAAHAFVLVPGTSTTINAVVVAWAVEAERDVPPKPIVAPYVPGARVAYRFSEHPPVYEWPYRTHASPDDFRKSAA
jgi:hypothetical protein